MSEFQSFDPDAELAVIAGCLESRLVRDEVRKLVSGQDFMSPDHEAIWNAMSALDRDGVLVDGITLKDQLGTNHRAISLLPDVITANPSPGSAPAHAQIVRSWSIKRQMHACAMGVVGSSLNPDLNPVGYAASIANQFAAIRDSGLTKTATAQTVDDLLLADDTPPDWLIPGLLERRDRFMLTGIEGLGKSHLLRQIALFAASGLDPFDQDHINQVKTTIIDCENSLAQVRRKIRPMVTEIQRLGGKNPGQHVVIDCVSRMDITTDKSLAAIHQLLDDTEPDMVVIGPLYRLVPRAITSDDEAAPLLAALDTIRDRGITLLIEAHAGHAQGKAGVRDLRPRGSSALLGWPEFGYGLRPREDGSCDLEPWRGDREERQWPERLRRQLNGPRWVPELAMF